MIDATSPIVLPDDPSFGPEVQVDYPAIARPAGARLTGRSSRCPRRSDPQALSSVTAPSASSTTISPPVRKASRSASGSSSRVACSTSTGSHCGARSSRSGRPTPAALRHEVDQHPAPLDPNFRGGAAASPTTPPLSLHHGQARLVSLGQPRERVASAHIHFSVFGRAFTQRLVTQMYFPATRSSSSTRSSTRCATRRRGRCSSRASTVTTTPEWALGYQWDIVLGRGGNGTTPFEQDGA